MNKAELIKVIAEEIAKAIGEHIEDDKELTNGEVIEAAFPGIESKLDKKTGIVLVKWTDGTTKTFKASWWNAPYKVKSEDKK